MSKERARARAERQAVAQTRSAAAQVEQRRRAEQRARRERRHRYWRRLRLWQHGPASRRLREAVGALFAIVAATMLLLYLFTGSLTLLVVVALVFVLVGPMLALLLFDRRRS